ncbi:MAG TPA: hypothetical protein PK961_01000 [bacterium]|nr:hypothetical protein [bacterium]
MRRLLDKILDPLREHRGALLVFLISCLAFLGLRLLILLSAVDNFHNVDEAEYQVIMYAKGFVYGWKIDFIYYHLWGLLISAAALVPFVLAGVADLTAMKILALLFAFVAFAALVYLAAWKLGPYPAGLMAAALMFPAINYLKWTLMIWGGYPEAFSLMSVAIFIWVAVLDKRTFGWFLFAGMFAGIPLIYSPAVSFMLAAVIVATPLQPLANRRWRLTGAYLLGIFLLLLPFLIWFFASGFWQIKENWLIDNSTTTTFTDYIMKPSLRNWRFIKMVFADYDIFATWFEFTLLAASTLWLTIASFTKRYFRQRWRVVFPLILAAALLFLLFFPAIQHLGARHLLGMVVAGYVTIALAMGDTFFGDKHPTARTVDRAVRLTLLAMVLLLNLGRIVSLVQPESIDTFHRFRGGDYYDNQFGSVIGPEIDRVNCLLDARLDFMQDMDAKAGFGLVFKRFGYYECCQLEPQPVDYHYMRQDESARDPAMLYRGLGCAMALKDQITAVDLTNVPDGGHPEAFTWLTDGFSRCSALPCAKLNRRDKRPAVLLWLDKSLAAYTALFPRWWRSTD